jgi:hypothetical protein
MKLLEIARIAEPIELRMNEAFWEVLPPSLAKKRQMKRYNVGGAQVSFTPRSTSLQRNRVIGLGVRERATEDMIDEIMGLFRAARVTRFSIHLSPCPQSEAIERWLQKRGFMLHHRYANLFRNTAPPESIATDLTVKRIGRNYAAPFVEIFSQIFARPDDHRPWLVATLGHPGFSHFLAFDGDRPIATGLLYSKGNSAWMGWGATLTQYRRRGAHAALIAARVKHAAELGAKWVVCATLEPVPKRPSGSYRNLIKQGFEVGYLRPIWVWEKR